MRNCIILTHIFEHEIIFRTVVPPHLARIQHSNHPTSYLAIQRCIYRCLLRFAYGLMLDLKSILKGVPSNLKASLNRPSKNRW